jgi:hypothetical protein
MELTYCQGFPFGIVNQLEGRLGKDILIKLQVVIYILMVCIREY